MPFTARDNILALMLDHGAANLYPSSILLSRNFTGMLLLQYRNVI
jgi:hypothetical protein